MPESTSKRWRLDTTDVRKIAKGAVIAMVGALMTYIGTVVIPDLQQLPEYQSGLFVLFCTVFNSVWKLWQENRTG